MAHHQTPRTRLTEADYAPLLAVVTMAEAARMWSRDPKTVRYAIDAGNIAAVRLGRIWLVSVPSASRAWGPPVNRPGFLA